MLSKMDVKDALGLSAYLESRSEDVDSELIMNVSKILADVKKNKDEALFRYKIDLTTLRVSDEEVRQAASKADAYFVECLKKAAQNIEFFHNAQKQNGYHLEKEMGIYLGQRVLPLDSVGIYV
ncbi:MAG: histidinol dehydrogenase, partial [Longicatena sp.]